jgi:hypothetical protein
MGYILVKLIWFVSDRMGQLRTWHRWNASSQHNVSRQSHHYLFWGTSTGSYTHLIIQYQTTSFWVMTQPRYKKRISKEMLQCYDSLSIVTAGVY